MPPPDLVGASLPPPDLVGASLPPPDLVCLLSLFHSLVATTSLRPLPSPLSTVLREVMADSLAGDRVETLI